MENNKENNFTKKIIYCKNKKNKKIYGEAYIPNSNPPFPLIIYSHGYGYNSSLINIEKLSSNNISIYKFDFCGGSLNSKSEGKSIEMSIMTEVEDLESVINEMEKQSFVNKNEIYLCGASQGSIISIIVGEKKQKELKGLILYCPSLFIFDLEKIVLGDKKVNQNVKFSNMMVSKKFFDDIRDYNIYETIKKINIPFLYYQGDKDDVVNIEYAYNAKKYFGKNGKLIILKNTGHLLNIGNEERLFIDIINFIFENKNFI